MLIKSHHMFIFSKPIANESIDDFVQNLEFGSHNNSSILNIFNNKRLSSWAAVSGNKARQSLSDKINYNRVFIYKK